MGFTAAGEMMGIKEVAADLSFAGYLYVGFVRPVKYWIGRLGDNQKGKLGTQDEHSALVVKTHCVPRSGPRCRLISE